MSSENPSPAPDTEPGSTPAPVSSSTEAPSKKSRSGPHPGIIAGIVALPVALIAGFIVYAASTEKQAETFDYLSNYDASGPAANKCASIMSALPTDLAGYRRTANPVGAGTTQTWNDPHGGTPVQVRCGIARPAALVPTSQLQQINKVNWLIDEQTDKGTSWIAVDRRPYVVLWRPKGSPTAVLQDVTSVIEKTEPAAPLEFK